MINCKPLPFVVMTHSTLALPLYLLTSSYIALFTEVGFCAERVVPVNITNAASIVNSLNIFFLDLKSRFSQYIIFVDDLDTT